jgi:hypothetical protein
MAWAGETHAFFRIVTFTSDPTQIAHKFWILKFGCKEYCQFNKTDRAKRFNQSKIKNLKLPSLLS